MVKLASNAAAAEGRGVESTRGLMFQFCLVFDEDNVGRFYHYVICIFIYFLYLVFVFAADGRGVDGSSAVPRWRRIDANWFSPLCQRRGVVFSLKQNICFAFLDL